MVQNIKKKMEGFTIIEVMIVLAIAGLIMLIVFLAIPALQRSQRNNGRNSDASKVAAAVNECLSNRNGQVASCSTYANISSPVMSQFTNATPVNFGAAAYNLDQAVVTYNAQCNAAGDTSTAPGPTAKAFSVTYRLEGGGATPINRCIGG